MKDSLTRYYRCRERHLPAAVVDDLSQLSGYILFGKGSTCYGSYRGRQASADPLSALRLAMNDVVVDDGRVHLAIDPSQIIDNLLNERYAEGSRGAATSTLADIYYILRPLLPVAFRKHLQRLRLRGWDKIAFPRWPVDCSVDNLLEQLMLLANHNVLPM